MEMTERQRDERRSFPIRNGFVVKSRYLIECDDKNRESEREYITIRMPGFSISRITIFGKGWRASTRKNVRSRDGGARAVRCGKSHRTYGITGAVIRSETGVDNICQPAYTRDVNIKRTCGKAKYRNGPAGLRATRQFAGLTHRLTFRLGNNTY